MEATFACPSFSPPRLRLSCLFVCVSMLILGLYRFVSLCFLSLQFDTGMHACIHAPADTLGHIASTRVGATTTPGKSFCVHRNHDACMALFERLIAHIHTCTWTRTQTYTNTHTHTHTHLHKRCRMIINPVFRLFALGRSLKCMHVCLKVPRHPYPSPTLRRIHIYRRTGNSVGAAFNSCDDCGPCGVRKKLFPWFSERLS